MGRLLYLVGVAALACTTGCLSFHRGPLPAEPAHAQFVDVDGVRVRYLDTGAPPDAPERPTVVLVHGFASALDVWDGVVPALARTHRVVALDLAGFGWSDRPEGDYSPAAQARLVLGLLDRRGVGRASIVAHSWGSSVALAATMQAPERIARIVLYDAFVYEDEVPTFSRWSRAGGVGEVLFGLFYTERVEERLAAAYHDHAFVTEKLVDDVKAAFERPGTVAAALATVRGQRFAEVEGRYRSIAKPTLVLWGREDRITPLRHGERLVRDLPDARLVVYPRCGHFPMIEAQSDSTRDLVAFLTVPP